MWVYSEIALALMWPPLWLILLVIDCKCRCVTYTPGNTMLAEKSWKNERDYMLWQSKNLEEDKKEPQTRPG